MTVIKFNPEAPEFADRLLSAARKNEPFITLQLETTAEALSANIVGLENKFKSRESLIRKIRQNAEIWHSSVKEESERINDSLRYTVIFSEEAYWSGFNSFLSALEASGYNVSRVFNAWNLEGQENDWGYRGVNVTIISSQKQKFELQFHTEVSYNLKTGTHRQYEELRTPGTNPERMKKIVKAQRKRASLIRKP